AAREVLLVELAIGVLPGIAVFAAPHLERRPWVAEERDGVAGAPARGDAIGRVGRPGLGGRNRRDGLAAAFLERDVVALEEDWLAGADQMGVGDEVLDPVLRQQLLDTGPHAPVAAAVAPRRRRPLVSRAVGAFRQPDAARRPPEVPAVRLDRGAQLQVDRLVAPEQRQVAVR